MMRCLILVAGLAFLNLVRADEAPSVPKLRVDPSMHTGIIWSSPVDGQGRWIITASQDKTARIWDLRKGELQRVLRPPIGGGTQGELFAAAVTRDGANIALGGQTYFRSGDPSVAPDGPAIYIFDRASGHFVKRIDGLSAIDGLAYSANGKYLAATLGGASGLRGLRVYRTDSWALLGEDHDYGEMARAVDFSGDGRIASGSADGLVRVYDVENSGLRLKVKQMVPGGKDLGGVRFSPDGRSIAVGFRDSSAVNVLDSSTLALRFAPDTAQVKQHLSEVGWSADGKILYAAGTYRVQERLAIRQWPMAGQGTPLDTPVAADEIMDLRSLPHGGVAFATADPSWGVLDANGKLTHFIDAPLAHFRNPGELRVSADGSTVAFPFEKGGGTPAHFSLANGLELGEVTGESLATPRTEAPGLQVTSWRRQSAPPSLNGKLLDLSPGERSLSLAIAPDGERFILGTEWRLLMFSRSGELRWRFVLSAAALAVNVSGDGRTGVAFLQDGTIRWFDMETGRLKLLVFAHADHKRWVAWTPSGYYKASPGGEDLIGWHLNRGKSTEADFFPASRFRAKYSRPDVIARALTAPSEAQALSLADADAGRHSESATDAVQTLLPPVVEILSPQDGATAEGSSVVVKYSTRTPPDAPVTGLRARLNGQAVSLPGSRGLSRMDNGKDSEITIPIGGADAEIQLFAENKNGVSVPAVLHLTWKGPTTPSNVAALLKPKLYVLSVGVSKYANPAFNLDLPAKDARDFANALSRQKGLLYSDVQVRLLIDADATKENVLDGLDWLQHQITARDVGMMLVAGHGMNDNTGKYFFLPYNADPERLLRTGVPQADIRDTLSSLAGKVVFFIDTCHSGNVLGTAKTRGIGGDMNAFVNDLASSENGVVVFTASTGGQFSLEDPAWGNGAFTKAVVEGLNGKADLDHSGRVTHKELDYYVAERVKELTGGKQSPVSITPNGLPDFPISVVPK